MVHNRLRFLGERFGSGDGERKTLLTRQIAFEPLPASVLFGHLSFTVQFHSRLRLHVFEETHTIADEPSGQTQGVEYAKSTSEHSTWTKSSQAAGCNSSDRK